MSNVKSPFLIYSNFISPLMCSKLLTDIEQLAEDDGLCLLKSKINLTTLCSDKIKELLPNIMNHYEITINDMTPPSLYELKQGSEISPNCDNSRHLNGKWVQIFPRDISGYIALCNYNDNIPFDDTFEVYGGKFEFPQHEFGFNPQIGTLILYPSGPHFIHKNTTIECGSLYYIQFFLKSVDPYLYNPANFPGDYTTWFREV